VCKSVNQAHVGVFVLFVVGFACCFTPELYYDRGNVHEFLNVPLQLAAPGELIGAQVFMLQSSLADAGMWRREGDCGSCLVCQLSWLMWDPCVVYRASTLTSPKSRSGSPLKHTME
jgi:hypothetical protein